MTAEDWQKHKSATECHGFLDSIPVFGHNIGIYCSQSHKFCYHFALKQIGFFGPKNERQKKDKIGQWIEKNQENCLFCAEPLMKQNHKDSVKDHCHITGKYCRAVHNECNPKLLANPKTIPIPVVFHNLRGYNVHHLMQAMSKLQKEMKCIARNMEKYITFSLGGLRFIDSLNFLQASLDSLVSATPKESLKITSTISKGNELLFKKGIYSHDYMDSWERFSETSLPSKERFYSKLNDQHITDEEYAHAQREWEAFE